MADNIFASFGGSTFIYESISASCVSTSVSGGGLLKTLLYSVLGASFSASFVNSRLCLSLIAEYFLGIYNKAVCDFT